MNEKDAEYLRRGKLALELINKCLPLLDEPIRKMRELGADNQIITYALAAMSGRPEGSEPGDDDEATV